MVLVSASAGGIHGLDLVAVVLGLVMSFLVMLMSWSGCSFLMCCSPSVSKVCRNTSIGTWLIQWRGLWFHDI